MHGLHQNMMPNHAPKAICEQKGSAGAGIKANLVSPHCVMLEMPGKHMIKRLVMLPHACMRRFCPLRRRDYVLTDSRPMMNTQAPRSGLAAQRKVGSASDLRVESCPRHTQRTAASLAILTDAIMICILHRRRSP